jgi:hypothetical protein
MPTNLDPNPTPPLGFRGKAHVDRKSGDVIFFAHMGLQLISCRVKRRLLVRLNNKPDPSDEEILKVFGDYRKRIEILVEAQVSHGEICPVISDLNTDH